MRGILAFDPDQPAKAGVHRNGLHPRANRNAFVEHVEQRIEATRLVCRSACAAQQAGQANGAGRDHDQTT